MERLDLTPFSIQSFINGNISKLYKPQKLLSKVQESGWIFIVHEAIKALILPIVLLLFFPHLPTPFLASVTDVRFSATGFTFEETNTQRGFIYTRPDKTRLNRVLAVFTVPFSLPGLHRLSKHRFK